MDSNDDQKQITKLMNTLMIQSRIIKLKLSVCQKYMVFVLLEEKRKCLTEIETETDFYCNSNKRVASIVEGTSILTLSVIWEDAANHCLLPNTGSQCLYYSHKLSESWNKRGDLLSPRLYCIQSASYNTLKSILLFSHTKTRRKERIHMSLKGFLLLWINFSQIEFISFQW